MEKTIDPTVRDDQEGAPRMIGFRHRASACYLFGPGRTMMGGAFMRNYFYPVHPYPHRS